MVKVTALVLSVIFEQHQVDFLLMGGNWGHFSMFAVHKDVLPIIATLGKRIGDRRISTVLVLSILDLWYFSNYNLDKVISYVSEDKLNARLNAIYLF